MLRVFVCYRRDDEWAAATIVEMLKDRLKDCAEVFWDQHIEGGELWPRKLQREIILSDVFLMLAGKTWDQDSYVSKEIGLAEDYNTKMLLIPLVDVSEILQLELSDEQKRVVARIQIKEKLTPDKEKLSGQIDELARIIISKGTPQKSVLSLDRMLPVPQGDCYRLSELEQIEKLLGNEKVKVRKLVVHGPKEMGKRKLLERAVISKSLVNRFVEQRVFVDATSITKTEALVLEIFKKLEKPAMQPSLIKDATLERFDGDDEWLLVFAGIDRLLTDDYESFCRFTAELFAAKATLLVSANVATRSIFDGWEKHLLEPLSAETVEALVFGKRLEQVPQDIRRKCIVNVNGSPRKLVGVKERVDESEEALVEYFDDLESCGDLSPNTDFEERLEHLRIHGRAIDLLRHVAWLPNGINRLFVPRQLIQLKLEYSRILSQLGFISYHVAGDELSSTERQIIQEKFPLSTKEIQPLLDSAAEFIEQRKTPSADHLEELASNRDNILSVLESALRATDINKETLIKAINTALRLVDFARHLAIEDSTWRLVEDAANRIGELELASKVRLKRGWLALWRNEVVAAREHFTTAAEAMASFNQVTQLAEAQWGLAKLLEASQVELAIPLFRKARDTYRSHLATNGGLATAIRSLTLDLAECLISGLFIIEADVELEFLRRELRKFDEETVTRVLKLSGDVERHRGRWESAIRHYQNVLEYTKGRVGCERRFAATTVGIAMVNYFSKTQKNDLSSPEQTAEVAQQTFRKLGAIHGEICAISLVLLSTNGISPVNRKNCEVWSERLRSLLRKTLDPECNLLGHAALRKQQGAMAALPVEQYLGVASISNAVSPWFYRLAARLEDKDEYRLEHIQKALNGWQGTSADLFRVECEQEFGFELSKQGA